jgi:hypothetical protein
MAPRYARRVLRIGKWTVALGVGIPVALVLVLIAGLLLLDTVGSETLRARIEAGMNAKLKGYHVTIAKVDFHVRNFGLDVHDLVLRQEANPEPAVATIPRMTAGLDWRALIRLRLVAAFDFVRPVVHINRQHLLSEANDATPVADHGWQEALEQVYPFKINHFTVKDGTFTYLDKPGTAPLRLEALNLRAANIRNVHSRDRTYPSDIFLEARVFETGGLRVDGDADFLAVPHAAVRGRLHLQQVPLGAFEDVAKRYNVRVTKGTLSTEGRLEYAPWAKTAHLEKVEVEGLHADYVHAATTATVEKQRAGEVAKAAKKVGNEPGVLVRIDELTMTGATVGYVNQAGSRPYRVFIDRATITLKNLSNHVVQGTAEMAVRGRFMGSGTTVAAATFAPVKDGPNVNVALQVEGTEAKSLNDLLRSYGNFDVVSGRFALYSELSVRGRRIDGYVKPLFQNLDVYDPEQDRDKSLFRRVYERVVGGLAGLLENRKRDEVATRADLSGYIDNPQASVMEIIGRLVQNAFFRSILPEFDRARAPRK